MVMVLRQQRFGHVISWVLFLMWIMLEMDGTESFAYQRNRTVLFLPSSTFSRVSERRNVLMERRMVLNDDSNDDREDYARKVAKAEKAIAEVQEAKRKLMLGKEEGQQSRNRMMRCRWSKTDAGTLELVWPCQGMNTGSFMSLAFSAAWFSAIIPTTFASLTAIPFLIPFYLAGGMVLKNGVIDPLVETTMSIGQYAYEIKTNYVVTKNNKIALKTIEGATEHLTAVKVDLSVIVNGIPQYELQIYDTNKASTQTIAASSDQEELLYLANEINQHLEEMNLLS